MKKLLFLFAFVGVASFAMAQSETPTQKYSVATNSFWSNWFINAGADYSVFYSSQENGMGFSKSPFKRFRRNWGFGVGVGKWFTPGLGLRTKFQGVWGKGVVSEVNWKNRANMKHYFAVNEQVLFNLSNLFFGYNPNRIWNVTVYPGAGIMHNMSRGITAIDLQLGIESSWKITDRLGAYADVNVIAGESKIDNVETRSSDNHAFFQNYDKIVSLEVGLKYNIGKVGWEKTPDVDAIMALNAEQLAALNASLKSSQDENDRLKALLAAKKDAPAPATNTVVKKEFVSTKTSVYFNINQTRFASKKDLVDVKELAEYAKNNGAKLVVTGYADSATGSSAYNKKLSENRAKAVADQLVKYGVSRDNIIINGAGGVNTLSPAYYNRRATVEIQ